MFLLGFHAVGGIGHGAFGDRIGKNTLLFLRVVKSEGGLYGEVLKRIDLNIGATKHSPVGITVVAIALKTGHGVLTVGITAYRTCVVARRSVNGKRDRKSTRLNSSHANISYAVFCLKKKKTNLTVYPHYPPT